MGAATAKPWTCGEDATRHAELGVGMEMWEEKLDPVRLDEQSGRLRDPGVAMASAQPRTIAPFPSLDAPEPKGPRERAGLYRDSIRRRARYVPGVAFVASTGALPDGDEARVWRGCIEHYGERPRRPKVTGCGLRRSRLPHRS